MTSEGTLELEAGASAQTLTDSEFAVIRQIAFEEAGLLLPDSKRVMVQSRISRRLRANGCTSLAEYVDAIRRDVTAGEREALVSVLTTNVTSFFRESHHFETLAETVLPPLLKHARDGRRVRIWSAGCSTGEEPFSLAMLITKLEPKASELDVRILATDVDQAVLKTARDGIYKLESVKKIDPGMVDLKTFEPVDGNRVAMPEHLRNLISFKQLNLHGAWPMRGVFDVVMCRNVVIYFDAELQARLWPRFYQALSPTGWLFLGHSERIQPLSGSGFIGRGLTTYQKSPRGHHKDAEQGE